MNPLPDPADTSLLTRYRNALLGMRLSAFWFGHGTALFLEFGRLVERRRRDGSTGAPRGEMSVMILFDWRVESRQAILAGSASESEKWHAVIPGLIGSVVEDVVICGGLPELVIQLSGPIRILSFMTDSGDPEWTIFQNRLDSTTSRYLSVQNGQLHETIVPDGEVENEGGVLLRE